MQQSLSVNQMRWLIIGLALLVLNGLGGCSALRLAYPQAQHGAYWWLDGHLDFDTEQSSRVKDGLAQWFEWHRQSQLPDYAALLDKAQGDMAQTLSPEQACQWSDRLRARLAPAFARALPLAAELVVTLSPAQLQHLEKRMARDHEKLRKERLQGDASERLERQVERSVERFESSYGPLDAAQRNLVAQGQRESPFKPEAWLAERQRRQRELLAGLRRILEERQTAAQAQQTLKPLVALFDGSVQAAWSPAQAAEQRALNQYNCALAARLHNSTSPEQRRHARDKLQGWEGDLRALAAPASGGAARAGYSAQQP